MKQIIKTLMTLGLCTNIARADMSIFLNNDNVIVNNTSNTWVYTLQSKTNLFDEVWSDNNIARGTESNLVFNINQDVSTKFFRVKGNYKPLEPIEMNMSASTSSNPHDTQERYFNFNIQNYSSNSILTEIIFEEVSNPYFVSYTIDLPKTNNLVPGTNNIPITFTFLSGGYGKSVYGKFIANIL